MNPLGNAHQDKTLLSSQAASKEKQQQIVDYWSEIKNVETKNLVFLDEMGVLLGLMKTHDRSRRGERVYALKPFYRGKLITVIEAITHNRCLAMRTILKGMNGQDFK